MTRQEVRAVLDEVLARRKRDWVLGLAAAFLVGVWAGQAWCV